MRMIWRDRIASTAVAIAVLVYLGWLVVVDDPATSGVRVMVATVLGLGFIASAVAVVPGFDELLHGSKAYLAVTSLLGLVALAAAVTALVTASTTMLTVLVVATVAMWMLASVRHAGMAHPA